MPTTVFIGSGALIQIGAPSTSELTRIVKLKEQHFGGISIPLINEISKILDKYYAPYSCNFEDIFYVLEMLETYLIGSYRNAHQKFKPPFAPFVDLQALNDIFSKYKAELEKFAVSPSLFISSAKSDLIKVIGGQIYQFNKKPIPNWFSSFWKKVAQTSTANIATLNYDCSLEQVLQSYNDGFEDTGYGFYRFNPASLNNNNATILHLHGCILYGYGSPPNKNEYLLIDNREDLSKFNKYEESVITWTPRWEHRAQTKDETIIGPIITGLRKTDKLIAYPYSFYYNWLTNSIIENGSLLIIGYSFGDIHFNSVLERILRLHKNCKIVVIDYINFSRFPCDNPGSFDGWPFDASDARVEIFSKFLKTSAPLTTLTNYKIQKGHPAVSDDGNTRIYLAGFKNAAENFGDDIIDFLK
jgi:hypothetical protein